MTKAKDWLICYDICQPGRLTKVQKLLRQEAFCLQRSVYFARLTQRDLENLIGELEQIIDSRCDDLRLFPQNADAAIRWCGKPLFPEGISFSAGPRLVAISP
ncbi:CRISPR-associated endonuclease Cas2 [Endozoicomonas montiporae]|uniref:CRISPR-associated endoribonuclease Cas2 n=1 Tax=Endozoicomonas montiporae CL-33 TaxID=570277 RepID=A0A142BBW7_9GAMM|nr:CRISPR-associated protein Cas2 [Endozoicomonas montiporae CL-33]